MLLLIVGGAILFSALKQTVAAYTGKPLFAFEEKSETEYETIGASSYSSDSSNFGPGTSPHVLSAFVTAGAALTFLGIFWMARQFSLRWLLIAVFVIGALGAVPLRIPERKGHAKFDAVIGPKLPDDQIELIRKALQPAAALATLHTDYAKKLKPVENAGILRVEVARSNSESGKSGVCCEINLRGDLDDDERQALLEFYEYYLNYLALSAAESSGMKVWEKSQKFTPMGAGWELWRKQWLTARDSENKRMDKEPIK